MITKVSQVCPTQLRTKKSENAASGSSPTKVLVIVFSKDIFQPELRWLRKYFDTYIDVPDYLSGEKRYLKRKKLILQRVAIVDSNIEPLFQEYKISEFDKIVIAATQEEKQLTRYIDTVHKVLRDIELDKIFYGDII